MYEFAEFSASRSTLKVEMSLDLIYDSPTELRHFLLESAIDPKWTMQKDPT